MTKTLTRILCLCLLMALTATTGLATETTPSLQDDFYEAVNADWLATAEIPPDKPAAGGFTELTDGIDALLMADFDAMLAGDKDPGSDAMQNLIAYYELAMDFDTRNAAGAAPLMPYLEQVEALTSVQDLSGQLAEWTLQGMPVPFAFGVMADMGNADLNALYVTTAGLFLLDKSYYEDATMKAQMQAAFSDMAMDLLMLVGKGEDEAATIVRQALAFDESLAPYTRSAEESSDYTKMYNPTDFATFDAQVEGFDLGATLNTLLGAVPETIIVTDPDYFTALDTLVSDDTFENLQGWLVLQTVTGFAPFLSDEIRTTATGFSRALSGIAQPTSPEKSAYNLAGNTFDEVVGIYYGETYFGEAAKANATDMVGALIETYETRLSDNDWLSEETRAQAVRKLQAMTINVGYPEEARPVYALLETVSKADGGTLLGNALAFNRIFLEDNYSDWNTPVDRGLWPLSAHTVNAMYSPQDNSINFPAAILQAPFFSIDQPASANYGGIGAVIAHEVSHAFDPNGAKFDEVGNLRDWWTAEDYATFETLSQAMVDEFDGIAFADGTVNGTLTVGENVADAGGLSCALEALKEAEADADLAAFFTSWATIWRQKASPAYETILLTLDVHAPNKLRANIQVQNLDDFYDAFDVQPGDGMYRAPEDRVAIW